MLVISTPSMRKRTLVWSIIGSMWMSEARCSAACRSTVATIFVTGASAVTASVSVMSFSSSATERFSPKFLLVSTVSSVSSSLSALPTSPESPLYCPSSRSKSVSVMTNSLYGIPIFADIKVSASRASKLSGSVIPTSSAPSCSPSGTSR